MRNQLVLLIAIALLNTMHPVSAVEGQFNMQFQRRFGLDSPIYNAPLYFQTERLKQSKTPRRTRYREKIKKQVNKEAKTRKRIRRS